MKRTQIGFLALALTLALSLLVGALPQEAQAARPDTYIIPGQNVFPEGIAVDHNGKFFYVGSTSTGTIYRGNIKTGQVETFLPGGQDGRTFAVGMKVDDAGRLFIAGGPTGLIFIYDTATGALIKKFDNGLGASGGTFINDVIITKDGAAYFTDSFNPVLYKVSQNSAGEFVLENWLSFAGTPLVYQPGFNANGIVASENGKYLIVVQSNTGKLFRVEVATKEVTQIDLGGATVTNGDGLVLSGNTLYVVRNANNSIATVRLSEQFSSGKVVSETTDPRFITPTTAALAQGRLLVVQSHFNDPGNPAPFAVEAIKKP